MSDGLIYITYPYPFPPPSLTTTRTMSIRPITSGLVSLSFTSIHPIPSIQHAWSIRDHWKWKQKKTDRVWKHLPTYLPSHESSELSLISFLSFSFLIRINNNKILHSEKNQVKVKVPLTPRRVTFHLSGIFLSPFNFGCLWKGGRMKKSRFGGGGPALLCACCCSDS